MIKRAYIMARQKEAHEALAQRIKAILFLATPHRGADLAQLLSKILNVSPGERPFVKDLHRNSLATQSINEEFPHFCQDLQLYSFYETLPVVNGFDKTLVVKKDAAVLGYPNESSSYLNANHREICKYADRNDPNYQTVRNTLSSIIDKLRIKVIPARHEAKKQQRKRLVGYLGVSDASEDKLMDIDASRLAGSCEWLIRKESFQEWRDTANVQFYWISAKPATGKTILSGKVVHHLQDLDRDLAFFFFDFRNHVQTTISCFLLSMASQIAHMHMEILQTVLDICDNGDQLRNADYRTIWRKLFMEGILRIEFSRRQYWVIDALDECKNGSDLVPLLLRAMEMRSNIHILLTSRDRFESHQQSIHPQVNVVQKEILEDDTKSDIALYLDARIDQLPVFGEADQRDMVSMIMEKSAGCFLWVSLILQELRQAHTSSEIRQILEDVPSDMNALYSRILDSMSKAPAYGKVLTRAILIWAVCSSRPLTTDELYRALQIDIRDKVNNIKASIQSRCGQLVYVDAQSRVQMLHQTARDFLLRASEFSEFGIEGTAGHRRLFMTCLECLNGNEMRNPGYRKHGVGIVARQHGPFVNYACNSFFEHLTHVSSQDDEALGVLAKLLGSTNLLSCIEYIAQHSDLNRLIQAGKIFKIFLQRRYKVLGPVSKELALLESWATDIIRLVTKFGKNLKASPSSIHHLIPPFCPSETAPRKQFAASTRGIAVFGLPDSTWDDCMSTIVDPQERFTALSCSDKLFAVGMESGNVVVYNESTCQQCQVLNHSEPVGLLQFGNRLDILISAGPSIVRIWNAGSWEQVWEFQTPQSCITLALIEEDQLLLGALDYNNLVTWDLAEGTIRNIVNWTQNCQAPSMASFCIESNLLAIAYRRHEILLWDLDRHELHDTYNEYGSISKCGKVRPSPGATGGLVFSATPNSTLLAAVFGGWEIVVFDVLEGTVKAETTAAAHTLACSPDGRTLASGAHDVIQIFDFESLKFLYRIECDGCSITELAFTGESYRLIDIRGSECRVWDPTVLVRQDGDEENSDTPSLSTVPQKFVMKALIRIDLVEVIECHPNGEVFFGGKGDGSVYLYETKSGRQSHKLLSHVANTHIVSLFFDAKSSTLSSLSQSNSVKVHRLRQGPEGWEAIDTLLDYRAGFPTRQVLTNHGATHILVCTGESDALWSIPSKETSAMINTVPSDEKTPSRWSTHPLDENHLIRISGDCAHLYEWQSLQRLTCEEGILLEGNIPPELAILSITSCFDNTAIATTFGDSHKQPKSKHLLWNAADFAPDSKTARPIPKYNSLTDQIRTLIGDYGRRLVFLHKDNWICSADPKNAMADHYERHFFLPADWLSTDIQLMIRVTRNGDVIFVRRDEVAVIKRGLDNIEEDEAGSSRPSLLGKSGGKRPLLKLPIKSV